MLSAQDIQRQRLTVNGVVQGVGFRPFIYRLAHRLALAGSIRNDARGVHIEVEGPAAKLDQFRRLLRAEAPALARIDSLRVEPLPPRGQNGFSIEPSRHGETAAALIPPDIAVCADCLREMHDPSDRRYRYPFTNCTNCGPRFTIVEGIPYDRPKTSMKRFPMCPACEREYHDPLDRRFHAQPVACPACGPRLIAHDGARELAVADPVAWAVDLLASGRILALRGLGGFHLAVDAASEEAVRRLRDRKQRQQKPFALMAPDVARVRKFCEVSPEEEQLLTDVSRPIVLLRRRPGETAIAPSVVDDNMYYGFMLPYTPLHHLLLHDTFDALVMTSGNRAEEPIVTENAEALARLGNIADGFLLHDRDILQRCDDSIVRRLAGGTRIVRRARGYVPLSVPLPVRLERPILVVGGELKSTVALGRADQVVLSQHIGDLDNPAALAFFEHALSHLQKLLECEPELIACDLHPEYLSTKWAHTQQALPVIGVQHHHAHLVSVLADNGCTEPAIGLILDGSGYGTDGTIWGGEVLIGDAAAFRRFAWLEPVPLPGGTVAIEQPWRMALSYLSYAYGGEARRFPLPLFDRLDSLQIDIILAMIDKGLNSPLTSSCGRLFDGVAALAGLALENTYEAQAAIALEMAATRAGGALPDVEPAAPPAGGGPLSFAHLIREVVRRVRSGDPVEQIAAQFHAALAELFAGAALAARAATGLTTVALSGGVCQNALFFTRLAHRLENAGFRVLAHREVPTNDGGLALGQAVIADAVHRRTS